MVIVQRTKAAEARIDDPQLAFGRPGQLMYVDIAGHMDAPWQEGRIVLQGKAGEVTREAVSAAYFGV